MAVRLGKTGVVYERGVARNALTQGLVALFTPAGELLSRSAPPTRGTAVVATTLNYNGRFRLPALRTDPGATAAQNWASFGTNALLRQNLQRIVAANMTVAMVGYLTGFDVPYGCLFAVEYGAGGGSESLAYRHYTNTSNMTLRWNVTTGGTDGVGSAAGMATAMQSPVRPFSAFSRRIGIAGQAQVGPVITDDGSWFSTTSSDVWWNSGNFVDPAWFNLSAASTAYAGRAVIAMVAVWNRALTRTELNMVEEDPRRLLAPPQRLFVVEGTGPATLSPALFDLPFTLDSSWGVSNDGFSVAALDFPFTLPTPGLSSTLNPTLLNQPLTILTPSVGMTLSPALFDQPLTLLAPTVVAPSVLTPALFDLPFTAPAPTLVPSTELAPAVFDQPLTLGGVTLLTDGAVNPPIFDQPLTLETPTLVLPGTVDVAAFDQPLGVLAPTLVAGSVVSVTAPFDQALTLLLNIQLVPGVAPLAAPLSDLPFALLDPTLDLFEPPPGDVTLTASLFTQPVTLRHATLLGGMNLLALAYNPCDWRVSWDGAVLCGQTPPAGTTEEQQAAALNAAVGAVWSLTGKRHGICQSVERLCGSCGCREFPGCGCINYDRIDLDPNGDRPVAEIQYVKEYGVALTPGTDWVVDGRRWLVRKPSGTRWPTCTDAYSDDPEGVGVEVSYSTGKLPPADLVTFAVYPLAIQLLKACLPGSECSLDPAVVQTVQREGISFAFVRQGKAWESGQTGIPGVDAAINRDWPYGLNVDPAGFTDPVDILAQRSAQPEF